MAGPSIDIRVLIPSGFNAELQAKVADILDTLVNTTSTSVVASAEAAANSIDELFPGGEQAEDYLWSLWVLLYRVAKRIPVDDARLPLLVAVLAHLKTKSRESLEIWGSATHVWSDLPLMGPAMRDDRNFTPQFDGSDLDNAHLAQWISINSFAAQILGSGIQSWTNFALWELRDGLEEPLGPSPAERDTYLATASEWIIHAGKVLFEEGKKGTQLSGADAKAYSAGKLFEGGKPGFSEERWRFWKQRLEVLSGDTSDEGVGKRVAKALGVINGLEG